MKFNEIDLRINWKNNQVRYDGHIYDIDKIKKISYQHNQIKHRCADNRYYSIDFKHTTTHRDKFYYVFFCNKCKRLFLKEIR